MHKPVACCVAPVPVALDAPPATAADVAVAVAVAAAAEIEAEQFSHPFLSRCDGGGGGSGDEYDVFSGYVTQSVEINIIIIWIF